MKRLIAQEPGIAVYVEEPDYIAKGNEVVAKVRANGICATDLAILSGEASFMNDGSTSYPVPFGHEWAGEVVAVGEDVKNIKVGDRIISDSGVACGKCDACLAGDYNACLHKRSLGTINAWPGSYAEYVMFPEHHVHKFPDNITYEQASLIEPAAIALGGIRKSHITPDTSVLVVGTGAIGMCAVGLLHHMGVKKVLLCGRTDYKLEIGKQIGATAVCNTKNQSITDFVKEQCGDTGVNVAIECSGNLNALNELVYVLSAKGTLSIASFFEKPLNGFDIDAFIMKQCEMQAVMGDNVSTQMAMKMVAEEGLDLRPIITRRIKFEEAKDLMTDMLKPGSKADIKVMINWED